MSEWSPYQIHSYWTGCTLKEGCSGGSMISHGGGANPKEGILLPPAKKLRQGNVFTPACQSFHSQGGGCGHHPGQTPLQADTPPSGRHLPGRHPRADTPWADTPFSRHPPAADTSLAQCMLGYTLPCPVHAEIRSTSGRYASHWNA